MDRLGLTFDYLATTDNEAATAVLLSSLEHRERTVAEGTVNALLRRKSRPGLDELVRKWHLLGDRLKALPTDRPGVLTASLKVAFLSADEQLIRNAADAAVTTADYDLATLFAQSVTDPSPLRRRLAAESVLRLAEMLYDELHSSTPARVRHDPQCIREFIVGSLEAPVTRFSEHRSRETLEAFLLLASRECATLRHLLQDSQEAAHEPLCDQLLRSTRPGVIRLLLSMLDEPHAPLVALRIIGRRRDVGFFRQLCKKLGEDHSPHVQSNLARIDLLEWLDDDTLSILTTLSEAEQPGAVVLAMRTKIPLSERLRILEQLLAEGQPLGRQAAARALFDTYGKECEWLVQDLIQDPCPLVQAEAARRLRECDVPDAVDILFGLLDSSSAEVRAAARHGLEDYTLKGYLQTIDSLSEAERITIGALVKRVDPDLIDELLQEMVVPIRARRLRALQAIAALEVAPLVATGLCELARDEYHGVRVEAARLLGECDGVEVRYTLRELQSDSLPAVQREAEQSLELIKKHSLRGRKLPANGGVAMNHLFWSCLVLAEGGRAGQFAKGFRAGNLDRVSVSSLLLIAAGGLLIALILYAWERFARSDERGPIFSERRLFLDLCRLHRLDRGAIRCLEDLIRTAKLVHAAEVFVRPDLFQTKDSDPRDRSLLKQLRSKLFSA